MDLPRPQQVYRIEILRTIRELDQLALHTVVDSVASLYLWLDERSLLCERDVATRLDFAVVEDPQPVAVQEGSALAQVLQRMSEPGMKVLLAIDNDALGKRP